MIILECGFNILLDVALEAESGSPLLKKISLSKPIETKEKCNYCDIWE